MSQSHLPPEEPHLSSEAPPQEGPAASQNPAPPAEDTAAQKAGKEKKPGAFGADLYGWLQALTFALAFILIFFTFFGRVIGVDGHSMDPTLNDRDMLFLQCIAYEPKQGDVVVLHKDFGDVETPIVKRVIAVGGQTVEIDYDTGTVYVDGQPLEEDYIMEPMVRPESPYLQGTYWEVPEGCPHPPVRRVAPCPAGPHPQREPQGRRRLAAALDYVDYGGGRFPCDWTNG